MNLVQITEIKEHFSCDPDTGHLFRIKESIMANTRPLPRRAEHNGYNGYSVLKFNNKRYLSHRVCYAIFYNKNINEFGIIDHINGNKKDNRVVNLREVTKRENCSNKQTHRDGKLVGCYFHKKNKKWMARYKIKNKEFYLGHYNTELEAHEVYKNAIRGLNEQKSNESNS